MVRFCIWVEVDKQLYLVFLFNGNDVDCGDLVDGCYFVIWEDLFFKFCYLFVLVVGDLVEKCDSFIICFGCDIDLCMYVELCNVEKCDYVMDFFKWFMCWDEEVYGWEYDFDIFMIVVVDDFNMGVMENKGLNIFNLLCVLVSQDIVIDLVFQCIEVIVVYEYFYNWFGNWVICCDWFQFSFKEGFIVFWDFQFFFDMGLFMVK